MRKRAEKDRMETMYCTFAVKQRGSKEPRERKKGEGELERLRGERQRKQARGTEKYTEYSLVGDMVQTYLVGLDTTQMVQIIHPNTKGGGGGGFWWVSDRADLTQGVASNTKWGDI